MENKTQSDNNKIEKVSRLTNSPIGSEHWFNTIVSSQKAISEILKGKIPSDENLGKLGESLYRTCSELIEGWAYIEERKSQN